MLPPKLRLLACFATSIILVNHEVATMNCTIIYAHSQMRSFKIFVVNIKNRKPTGEQQRSFHECLNQVITKYLFPLRADILLLCS